jgi:hypothetical protein
MAGPATLRWAIDGTFICTGLTTSTQRDGFYKLGIDGTVKQGAVLQIPAAQTYNTIPFVPITKCYDFTYGLAVTKMNSIYFGCYVVMSNSVPSNIDNGYATLGIVAVPNSGGSHISQIGTINWSSEGQAA